MPDQEKNSPPSELKLSHLRQAGIVPFSRDLMTGAVVAGLTIGLMVLFAKHVPEIAYWFVEHVKKDIGVLNANSAQKIVPEIMLERTGAFSTKLLLWTIALIGPILLAAIVIGALQTKFLFTFARFGFGSTYVRKLDFKQRLYLAILNLLKVGIVSFVFVAIMFFSFGYLISIENVGQGKIFIFKLLLITLVLALIIGVISRIVVVLNFKREHRMTRDELAQESREGESPPDVKRAIKELS